MEAVLEKNALFEAEIDGLTSQAEGVCRLDGRAVFVPRALPGERWRVRIVKVTKTAVYGRGEALLSPSPARLEPACPAFGRCGGCAALHMDYAAELRFKLGRVNDALRRIGPAGRAHPRRGGDGGLPQQGHLQPRPRPGVRLLPPPEPPGGGRAPVPAAAGGL